MQTSKLSYYLPSRHDFIMGVRGWYVTHTWEYGIRTIGQVEKIDGVWWYRIFRKGMNWYDMFACYPKGNDFPSNMSTKGYRTRTEAMQALALAYYDENPAKVTAQGRNG